MLKYSFIEHPIYYLFSTLDQMIPNVKKAYALFSDEKKNVTLHSLEENQALDFKNKKHLIQKFRAEKRNTSWVRPDMIDFLNEEKKKKKIQQLSLIDENENNILCLKFISPYDDLYDVIFIELTPATLLQFSKEGSELTTSQKTLVEVLLYNTLKARLETEYANLKTHAVIIGSFQNQQTTIKEAVADNEQLKLNYDKTFNYFLTTIAHEVKEKYALTLDYSPTCIAHISLLSASLETIRLSILQAATVAQNLSIGKLTQLTLEPENIQLIVPKAVVPKSSFANKHQNVLDMLDKYEKAAVELEEKGMKVNGANVAEQCVPSITPAAISFNLKKYATVINQLVEKYETKWPLIKMQFKPLLNILEKNDLDKKSKIA